jgi:hypothetical protein
MSRLEVRLTATSWRGACAGHFSAVSIPSPTTITAIASNGSANDSSCLHRFSRSISALPIQLDKYLSLLDWTGRQLRAASQGPIPAQLAPMHLAAAVECKPGKPLNRACVVVAGGAGRGRGEECTMEPSGSFEGCTPDLTVASKATLDCVFRGEKIRWRDATSGQSLTRLAVNVTLRSSPTFRPLPASQMIVSPGKTTFEKSVLSTFTSLTWYGSR